MLGVGIKTFQTLAKGKGHYGSVMIQRLSDDTAETEKFHAAKHRRISHSDEAGGNSFGDQTLNIVATAALYTDPDVSRFVNALAIRAMLVASEQLKLNDDKERFAGAFEIHVPAALVPTMHFLIFYRERAEAGIKRLHEDLIKGNIPGMERFDELGIKLGKTGLTKPYSRYGPGGVPYLHGNSDGKGGLDQSKDWKCYKIPIEFPDTPQFGEYKCGNPALATHLDDVAGLSASDLTQLLCEMELPDLDTLSKTKFSGLIRANIDSLDSLAAKFNTEGDGDKAKAVESIDAVLNVNTVYDIQNTKSAEFWRSFK